MSDFSFDTLITEATEDRAKQLRTAIGGPLADLKAFLEGDADHHVKLEVALKLAELLRDPKSVVTVAAQTNGRPALALGGSTDTDTPTHPDADLARRFSGLTREQAAAAVQFGEKLGDGTLTKEAVTAMTLIVDGNPDWRIVEDNTGQPVLESLRTARAAAASTRSAVNTLATAASKTANQAEQVVTLAERLAADPNLPGPDPADMADVRRNAKALRDAATAAKRTV